jgi:hypothetical protein
MAEYLLEQQELPEACTGWEHLQPTDSLPFHLARTLIAYSGAWTSCFECLAQVQVAVSAHRRVATVAVAAAQTSCRMEAAEHSTGGIELLNLVEVDVAMASVAVAQAAAESFVVEAETRMADRIRP